MNASHDAVVVLYKVLPPRVQDALYAMSEVANDDVMEVVLDLGRIPAVRLLSNREISLPIAEVSGEDIAHVVERVGGFDADNRAGIERTLHRISAMRNRRGEVIGLTCRVGRAMYGVLVIAKDIVESGRSLLLLGAPGVGKTTLLRESARVVASELHKRVVIIDTSNEIAGDGDIPHEAIGRARRMQVPAPALQHRVMIEAVENHMPEVIIIDEIGVEEEALAARTIAERGVQLIGTAHGRSLENLILNPTLVDLVGGIQSVTLSDEEAYRRNSQKSVLERMRPPTFSTIVEILGWEHLRVYHDAAIAVDTLLSGGQPQAEVRKRTEQGEVVCFQEDGEKGRERLSGAKKTPLRQQEGMGVSMGRGGVLVAPYGRGESLSYEDDDVVSDVSAEGVLQVALLGVSRKHVERAAEELQMPVRVAAFVDEADVVLCAKHLYRKRPKPFRAVEAAGVPLYLVREDTMEDVIRLLEGIRASFAF